MNKRMRLKLVALLAGALLVNSQAASAESFWTWLTTITRTKGVQPVTNKRYLEECGSCHFAYQPGLLPTKSWEKLLNEKALSDHFGDNAELEPDVLKEIRDYALQNASETSHYKLASKVTVATENGEAPLRITEVRFIKRKHHDIPEKMIKGNNEVKSLSNCNACHTQAEKGVYDPDTVSIPNYPKR